MLGETRSPKHLIVFLLVVILGLITAKFFLNFHLVLTKKYNG